MSAWLTRDFRGPFDVVMDFFFYIPDLLIVQLILCAERSRPRPAIQFSLATAFAFATLFLAVGAYYFTRYYWGPAIVTQLIR